MRLRLALAAGVAALSSVFIASAAQAYPDPVIGGTGGSAADGQVGKGATFTLTGDFGGTDCEPWVGAFNGQSQSGAGSDFSVTFTAPDKDVSLTLTITCTYDDGTTPPAAARSKGSVVPAVYYGGAADATPVVIRTKVLSFPIVVGAGSGTSDSGSGSGSGTGSDSSSGALPNTGGINSLYLIAGAALVVVGGGAVVEGRRRSKKAA